MSLPYRWCQHYPGVYVTPLDAKPEKVHGVPPKEGTVDLAPPIRVYVIGSCSAAGDCVYDAETSEFLGYTEDGTHLDCGRDYKHFDEPRRLEVVSDDEPTSRLRR